MFSKPRDVGNNHLMAPPQEGDQAAEAVLVGSESMQQHHGNASASFEIGPNKIPRLPVAGPQAAQPTAQVQQAGHKGLWPGGSFQHKIPTFEEQGDDPSSIGRRFGQDVEASAGTVDGLVLGAFAADAHGPAFKKYDFDCITAVNELTTNASYKIILFIKHNKLIILSMKAYFLLFISLNGCKSDILFEKSGCNARGKFYNKRRSSQCGQGKEPRWRKITAHRPLGPSRHRILQLRLYATRQFD